MTADGFPLWLTFAALVAGGALALEGGYRFGRRRQAGTGAEKEAPVGAMAAAILGLFAFLLAFTFGLAATRFEARRQAVLEHGGRVGLLKNVDGVRGVERRVRRLVRVVDQQHRLPRRGVAHLDAVRIAAAVSDDAPGAERGQGVVGQAQEVSKGGGGKARDLEGHG